jgi:hypothetical protein
MRAGSFGTEVPQDDASVGGSVRAGDCAQDPSQAQDDEAEATRVRYPPSDVGQLVTFPEVRALLCKAMEIIGVLEKAKSEAWTDEEIVDRVKAGDTALYEIIMRRYNQRLYRVDVPSCATMPKRKT